MDTKKIYLFVIAILAVLAGWLGYLNYLKSSENFALQLRLKQMERRALRRPTPWKNLLEKLPEEDEEKAASGKKEEATREESENTDVVVRERELKDPVEMTLEELARTLDGLTRRHQELRVRELDYALSVAEELLSRVPTAYSAYKAKLILMLTKESAHGEEIDDVELERTLEEMSDFDVTDDDFLEREAFLFSRASTELENMDERVGGLQDRLAILDAELEEAEEGSLGARGLLAQRNQLLDEIDSSLQEQFELRRDLEDRTLSDEALVKEELVRLPLDRGLARGRYNEVIDQAEGFIDQFPESTFGYFYLIRALDLSGRKDEAREVIGELGLSREKSKLLEKRLNDATRSRPTEYWRDIRF